MSYLYKNEKICESVDKKMVISTLRMMRTVILRKQQSSGHKC